MKLLLLTLAAASCVAQAETLVKPNGNGEIVLTERLCVGHVALYYAYSYTDKKFTEGCWCLINDKVYIYWSRSRKTYDLKDFSPEVKNER